MVKIWESYCNEFGGLLFLEHSVVKISNNQEKNKLINYNFTYK